MRIAALSTHLPTVSRVKCGGVAYAAHRLANALCQRGHAVTVFTTDEPPADARYEVRTVLSHRPSGPLRAWLHNWRLSFRFAAQDFSGFDIIHAHGDDALIWKPGPPLVRTFHGAALAEALHAPTWNRKLWYLSFVPRELWEAAKADVVVATIATTRRNVPGIDHVIPNSVDGRLFYADNTPKSANPSILFVGTMDGRKRGRKLLQIFQARIRPALPDAELWLVADQVVNAPGVVSIHKPDDASLADLYRKAWVLCLPSTYEGFGIPYIEAMACGTPVVATPNDGARALLEDGKWGLLAHVEVLGSTLLSMLQDASGRQRLANLGLQRAGAFTQDRVASAYESLFMSLISATARPARARNLEA